ncbi:hypothetical protein K440DRAFT_638722 [Wilcoxina mikolae CBS 423.85]|nr:hypothetical protein K440DRAFT_638722 [Wilcoxina mikolae CBS 423.85]
MSSFLRRSKSSRDPRRQALSRDQQQQEQLPYTPYIASTTTTLKSDLPLRAYSTATKRSGGIYGPCISSSTQPTGATSESSKFLRLARRKSISSIRESGMALGAWNPPATANPISAAEMKKRTSIFFGLASPAAPRPTTPKALKIHVPEPPSRAAPPPPIRLSAFPFTSRSRTPTLTKEDMGGMQGGDLCPIGVALGSPSGTLKPLGDGFTGFQSIEALSATQSPAFLLPSEPFGINSTKRTQSSGRGAPVVRQQQEEPPKTGGWKRMFGKGLFGRRNSAKTSASTSREVTPELPDPAQTAAVLAKPKNSGRPVTKTPCIDVDIPCVEMERYSVMFGSLLPPSEKSSLFARRRSRDVVSGVSSNSSMEDLSNQDALTKLNSNSVTAENPRLQVNSLKRNATTGGHLSPRSPLSRLGDDLRRISSESRVSGSTLTPIPSPGLNSVGLGRSHTTAVDGRVSPLPPQPGSTLSGRFSPPPFSHSLREQSFYFSSPIPDDWPSSSVSKISEESSIETPLGSFDEGDDRWLTRDGEDSFDEPTWEMMTKDSTTATTNNNNNNSKNSPKDEEGANLNSNAVKYRVSIVADEQFNLEELATAAQISIARQISLSQRQLLIPIVPKSQRLISRKSIKDPMKPRLVEHRLSSMPAAVKKSAEKATVETV